MKSMNPLRRLGLATVLAACGVPAWATVTCVDYSPVSAAANANTTYNSAADWDPYAPPTTAERAQLGWGGAAPSFSHGQLLACYRLSAFNAWAYTGLSYLDRVTITRHVTADSVGKLALGSAAVFTSSVNPEVSGVRPTIVINTPTAGIPAKCGATVQLLDNDSILKSRVQDFLQRGYTVIVPDYFGHGIRGQALHPYLEGRSLGQSVLDAIVAAKPLVAQPSAPLVMQGYSQGGQATAWASYLAPTYGPSLSFSAIRAGGVLVDAMATLIKTWDTKDSGGSDGGLIQMALVGMLNATDPSTRLTEADIQSVLTNQAKWPHVQGLMAATLSECRKTLQWQSLWDGIEPFELSLNLLRTKLNFQNWVMKNSLNGATAAANFPTGVLTSIATSATWPKPTVPFYYYHSQSDEVIPYSAFVNMASNVWLIPSHTRPKTSLNYTDVARLEQVWTTVTDIGGHGLAEAHMYTTSFPATRYMPEEWLHDSVYGGNRTDLKSDGSYKDPSL